MSNDVSLDVNQESHPVQAVVTPKEDNNVPCGYKCASDDSKKWVVDEESARQQSGSLHSVLRTRC